LVLANAACPTGRSERGWAALGPQLGGT
jgi:hypothetical protein